MGPAVIALSLIAFGVISRRVEGTPVTPAIIFVGIGLVLGTQALDLLDAPPTGESVRLLAEATLTVVLFADASRIDLRTLRREYAVPARLLGIGLPLTIGFGALLATALFGALSVPEALVLAVLLAPTDAALGQAVVTEPRRRLGSARDSTSKADSTTASACLCSSSCWRSPRQTRVKSAPLTLCAW